MPKTGRMSRGRGSTIRRVQVAGFARHPYGRPGVAGRCRWGAPNFREVGIARAQGFRDIAFPAIATGVYGFPCEAAARIAVTTVAKDLADQQWPELVIFVCFDSATLGAY